MCAAGVLAGAFLLLCFLGVLSPARISQQVSAWLDPQPEAVSAAAPAQGVPAAQPEEEAAPLQTVFLPLDQLDQAEALAQGADGLVLPMKTDDGALGYVSAIDLAADAGTSWAGLDRNQALRELNDTPGLYTVAQVSCLRDDALVQADPALALQRVSGSAWRDEEGLAWLDPTDTQVQSYLAGVCQELAQLGFVQSDVMSYAYNGERLFEGVPVTNFSTVAALYMEQVQIVTLDPNIKSVADLKGKNVSIGSSGSGVYYNALDILGAYDLTEEDINPTFQSFGDSVDALQDGKIDAAFVVAGAPTTAVTSLATSRDVYLISLDEEHIAKLKETSPYYTESTIAADVYGTVEDCTTVAVGAIVIARDDVSQQDVYNFISTIYENIDSLSHDKAKELDLEFAASVTNIPYHPGAAQYFAEKGIEVPTK